MVTGDIGATVTFCLLFIFDPRGIIYLRQTRGYEDRVDRIKKWMGFKAEASDQMLRTARLEVHMRGSCIYI
jgi:hypothetical protein